MRDAGGADTASTTSAACGLDSLAGGVATADIFNLDPFGSKLVTAEMTADDLARLVKTKFNDTVNLDESHRVDIYITTPYTIRTNDRFEAQSVVFPELEAGRKYRVAMGDYIFRTYADLNCTDGRPTERLVTEHPGGLSAVRGRPSRPTTNPASASSERRLARLRKIKRPPL